jgi:hypothetical protein
MAGYKYVVYANRWTEVAFAKQNTKSSTICTILRQYFINFGVPEELSCDGGPQYESMELNNFLKTCGVEKRLSSAYYPQSNGRAEAAVKTMKRILTTNIPPSGSLDTDEVAKALLLHRNTPLKTSVYHLQNCCLHKNVIYRVPLIKTLYTGCP